MSGLPSSTESVAALESVGLTANAAGEVYNNFLNKPLISPDDLLSFACGHVARLSRPDIDAMPVTSALDAVNFQPQAHKCVSRYFCSCS
jgi:hypothetical protein